MNFVRLVGRIGLSGLATMAMVFGMLCAQGSHAMANGVARAGYVVWGGQGSASVYERAPEAYNFLNALVPAAVRHESTGRYLVLFPDLDWSAGELAGIAHARAQGGSGTCAPDKIFNGTVPVDINGQVSNLTGRVIRVYCFDSQGNPADTQFAASYASKTEVGGLVHARLKLTGAAEPLSPYGPLFIYSSTGTIAGQFSATPGAVGQYTIDVPYLPVNAPATFQVTAEPRHLKNSNGTSYLSPVTCGITGTSIRYSTLQQRLVISCIDTAGNPSSVDYVNITYARGANTLGQSWLPIAYADVPLLTVPMNGYNAPGMNVIYGISGSIKADRIGMGWYVVHFQNQNWGTLAPSIAVTAKSGTAKCQTSTWKTPTDANVFVYCWDATFNYVDTGFHIQYVTRG